MFTKEWMKLAKEIQQNGFKKIEKETGKEIEDVEFDKRAFWQICVKEAGEKINQPKINPSRIELKIDINEKDELKEKVSAFFSEKGYAAKWWDCFKFDFNGTRTWYWQSSIVPMPEFLNEYLPKARAEFRKTQEQTRVKLPYFKKASDRTFYRKRIASMMDIEGGYLDKTDYTWVFYCSKEDVSIMLKEFIVD